MERLAIAPDGAKLYGIVQSALLQDRGLNAGLSRVGTNNRMVEVDATGEVREFLYPLEDKGNGVSETAAVNDHQFLVLERDDRAGAAATFKKLFLVDVAGAMSPPEAFTRALP